MVQKTITPDTVISETKVSGPSPAHMEFPISLTVNDTLSHGYKQFLDLAHQIINLASNSVKVVVNDINFKRHPVPPHVPEPDPVPAETALNNHDDNGPFVLTISGIVNTYSLDPQACVAFLDQVNQLSGVDVTEASFTSLEASDMTADKIEYLERLFGTIHPQKKIMWHSRVWQE
jgi:hypothetical protein